MQRDKKLHLIVTALIMVATFYILLPFTSPEITYITALAIALLFGLLKEILDATIHNFPKWFQDLLPFIKGTGFSFYDLGYDLLGIPLGSILIVIIEFIMFNIKMLFI